MQFAGNLTSQNICKVSVNSWQQHVLDEKLANITGTIDKRLSKSFEGVLQQDNEMQH